MARAGTMIAASAPITSSVVISLDIARDQLDPESFIATGIYEDGAALERQESAPEVHLAVAMFPEALAAPLERTIYDGSLDPALVWDEALELRRALQQLYGGAIHTLSAGISRPRR
jgi:hypothetical protein